MSSNSVPAKFEDSSGASIIEIQAGGTDNWAEIDLKSTYNVDNKRVWNLAARGSGGFAIRQLNDARTIATEMLVIDTNGHVGIGGTPSPAYRLHVVGAVYATGLVYCNGNPVCSDQRWKTNIKPIQNALDNVLKMQGITYYWKVDEYPDKHFPEGEQVGFIAQEIEKVYPQVVLTDKDGYKSVDYSKFTPVLVESIKEQQQMIEELQQELAILRQENAYLKQTLKTEIQQLQQEINTLKSKLPE